jgi:hypothetical protein
MEAQRKRKAQYKYDHAHNADSVKEIMKLLDTVNTHCNRTAVPAPKGFANLVTDKLQELVDAEDSDLFTKDKSAMTATPESKSPTEQLARRGRASQWKVSHRTPRWTTRTFTSPPSRSTWGPCVLPTRRSTIRAKRKFVPHKVNPTK